MSATDQAAETLRVIAEYADSTNPYGKSPNVAALDTLVARIAELEGALERIAGTHDGVERVGGYAVDIANAVLHPHLQETRMSAAKQEIVLTVDPDIDYYIPEGTDPAEFTLEPNGEPWWRDGVLQVPLLLRHVGPHPQETE